MRDIVLMKYRSHPRERRCQPERAAALRSVPAGELLHNAAAPGGFATGRFSTAEEVATLVVLLASERTANVTGANYIIDGGLIKTT